MAEYIIIENGSNFRHVLALSILTRKPVHIQNLGSNNYENGITEFESNLMQLIDRLTDGSKISLSNDGYSLKFHPGTLIGGRVKHKCSDKRSIGYYLEFVSWIVLMLKYPLELMLEGVTNSPSDTSVDLIKVSTLPLLKKFGFDEINISIKRRGYPPRGGGEVHFTCKPIWKLKSINLSDPGKIRHIRGISYSMRVSPKICHQMVEHSKGILLDFIPDIYITTDHAKGFSSGLSPGYGLLLQAETTTDLIIAAECSCPTKEDDSQMSPEEVADYATRRLLREIYNRGCVDTNTQSLLLIYMACSPQWVSKVLLPEPSDYIIQLLRIIKTFLGLIFRISPATSQKDLVPSKDCFLFSCIGCNIQNTNRPKE